MSHIWIHRQTPLPPRGKLRWLVNVSCHTYKRVMSHTWMGQATHYNTPLHLPNSTLHIALPCIYVIWLICIWNDLYICDMTHMYVKWLVYMWYDSYVCEMTCIYVIWLICTRNTLTCIYVIWLICMWNDLNICNLMHFVCHESRIVIAACM